jgi:hypothetical protein
MWQKLFCSNLVKVALYSVIAQLWFALLNVARSCIALKLCACLSTIGYNAKYGEACYNRSEQQQTNNNNYANLGRL